MAWHTSSRSVSGGGSPSGQSAGAPPAVAGGQVNSSALPGILIGTAVFVATKTVLFVGSLALDEDRTVGPTRVLRQSVLVIVMAQVGVLVLVLAAERPALLLLALGPVLGAYLLLRSETRAVLDRDDAERTADRLHSAAIHLLRRLRREDVGGEARQAAYQRLEGVFASAAHDVAASIFQQAYAPVGLKAGAFPIAESLATTCLSLRSNSAGVPVSLSGTASHLLTARMMEHPASSA